jgi:orotidine-5'-phosphate decarboxylase
VPQLTPRERLIIALDVPEPDEARRLVREIGDAAEFYKIGLELVMRGGLSLVRELADRGLKIFLDMKLLDIANTVEKATRNAAQSGATFLTIHALDGKTIRAAAAGAAGSQLKVLGVTVLTSLDGADLAEQGIRRSPEEMVVARARLAAQHGIAGVIASGLEAKAVRASTGSDFLIVTPGIRFPDNAAGDQARVMTPDKAIAAGADYLVAGRPITEAATPRAAAERFVAAIASARG